MFSYDINVPAKSGKCCRTPVLNYVSRGEISCSEIITTGGSSSLFFSLRAAETAAAMAAAAATATAAAADAVDAAATTAAAAADRAHIFFGESPAQKRRAFALLCNAKASKK